MRSTGKNKPCSPFPDLEKLGKRDCCFLSNEVYCGGFVLDAPSSPFPADSLPGLVISRGSTDYFREGGVCECCDSLRPS